MANPYQRKASSAISLSTDFESAYEHFIKKVIQQQNICGIATDQWVLCATASGQKAMPIWSEMYVAQASCFGDWQDAQPQLVELSVFMQKIIPYLIERNMLLAINRNLNGEALFVHPERLQAEIVLTH